MYAVSKVQPVAVELLLEKGADPTIRSTFNFTVLDNVRSTAYSGSPEYKENQLRFMRLQKRSEDDIARWLQHYELQYSPEMLEKRQKIKKMIEKAYFDKKTHEYESPIWQAVVSGDLSEVKSLLENKNISNINTQNNKGETPLIIAVKNGHYNIAELLLSKGAKIGILDNKNETAYSYAKKMLERFVRERQKRDILAIKNQQSNN